MKKIIGLTIIFFLSSFQVWAGWKIVIQESKQGIMQDVTYTITESGVKITTNDFEFMYYKSAKKIIVINHRMKSFFFGSFNEYKTQLKDLYLIDSHRADSLLPRSNRYLFEKYLTYYTSSQDSAKTTAHELKLKDEIVKKELLGYAAHQYGILLDTTLIGNIWVSQEIKIKNESLIFEAFNFFRSQSKTNQESPNYERSKEYDRVNQKGIIMKSVLFKKNGAEFYSSDMILIEEVDTDEEEIFSIPNTYEARTLIDLVMAKE